MRALELYSGIGGFAAAVPAGCEVLAAIDHNHLANEVYDESKVATWVDRICDQSMQKLTQMNKPFKYVVTCILMQKNGAGVHTGQSCFWDVANDNCARIAYPLASKKQAYDPRMYCVVTCFGVSM